jgi:ribosome-associated protein
MRLDEDEPEGELPSKSERKRAALEAQALGEALIELSDAELAQLKLPETLSEALTQARRMTSRGALARQRQYIGKLMRELDLAPIRAKLAEKSEQRARESQRLKRIEAWRERLVKEGAAALAELERWRPGLDRDRFLGLIAAARRERSQAGVGNAGRELFRALDALFATMDR